MEKKNGEVKSIINTEVMGLEEARNLLHDMIEKEYTSMFKEH